MKWFLLLAAFVAWLAISVHQSNDEERRATDRALDALEQEIDPN